jgi:hypothetical protein
MRKTWIFIAVAVALAITVHAASALAETQIKKSGKLTVPEGVSLMAFCTDPTVEAVLSQDFRSAKRTADANATSVTALTVSVTQQLLKPGVSMSQVAPGDPEVADLLKAAGATPPPLGDTGNERDTAGAARELAGRGARPASDSPIAQLLNQLAAHGNLAPDNAMPCDPTNPQPGCVEPTPRPKPGSPGYTGDTEDYLSRNDPLHMHKLDDKAFQTAVVARASLSGSTDELIVVAVVEPGDDVTEAKKLVAEEITNAVLH